MTNIYYNTVTPYYTYNMISLNFSIIFRMRGFAHGNMGKNMGLFWVWINYGSQKRLSIWPLNGTQNIPKYCIEGLGIDLF